MCAVVNSAGLRTSSRRGPSAALNQFWTVWASRAAGRRKRVPVGAMGVGVVNGVFVGWVMGSFRGRAG